ncbi:hypothetical protein DOY81_006005 [Sarcophaga bullata]|nr:hypothetical protein DOY81_006005 [Sarcophaga bullata]
MYLIPLKEKTSKLTPSLTNKMFTKHFRRKLSTKTSKPSSTTSSSSSSAATMKQKRSSSLLSLSSSSALTTNNLLNRSSCCRNIKINNNNSSSTSSSSSSSNTTMPSILILAILLSLLVNKISAIGNFELEILEISNTNSHLLSGYCCGVPLEIRSTKTTGCPPCSTAFRLCLKEYSAAEQGTPSISTGCSFGNTTTAILGGSSFVLSDPVRGAMVLPFTFRWTKPFFYVKQLKQNRLNHFFILFIYDIIFKSCLNFNLKVKKKKESKEIKSTDP